MTATIQVRADVGGEDRIPHTFIVVTHPDGRVMEYGLVPFENGSPAGPGKIGITGPNSPSERTHEWSVSTPSIQLTPDQYTRLMDKITDSINNPPDYTVPGQWWPSDADNCTGWVNDVWQAAGLPTIPGVTDQSTWNPYGQAIWIDLNKLKDKIKDFFDAAKDFILPPRRDPLTLDLDGDGLETIGIAATNPIQFDHDGDGIKNGTGWVLSDDAFLVLDKNGNGSIDNGRELFGDSTIKSNGQTAADGFDALADLDSNLDGKISNLDAQFAHLRLWRDLNQDGISQSGELFTLTQLNISSINVTKTANSQTLANGNQIADLGTFTKTDGATGNVGAVTGNMADINLASDTFHRTFPNVLDTTSVATLPDMQGSGAVRDLREAATQSTTLQNLLTEYSATTTRAGQMALIDQLLDAWADTGGLAETSQTRHCERSEAIQTLLDKLNILPLDSSILVQTYSPISMRLSRMNNQLQLVYSAGTTLAVAKHTFECLNRTKLTTFSLNTNKTAVNNDEWRIAV